MIQLPARLSCPTLRFWYSDLGNIAHEEEHQEVIVEPPLGESGSPTMSYRHRVGARCVTFWESINSYFGTLLLANVGLFLFGKHVKLNFDFGMM